MSMAGRSGVGFPYWVSMPRYRRSGTERVARGGYRTPVFGTLFYKVQGYFYCKLTT